MKKRREEIEEEWKRVKKQGWGQKEKKKENNKVKEVPSGRWYYEVSLHCRPVVLPVFVCIYIIIK